MNNLQFRIYFLELTHLKFITTKNLKHDFHFNITNFHTPNQISHQMYSKHRIIWILNDNRKTMSLVMKNNRKIGINQIILLAPNQFLI
jgi:hypothetical protein